MGPGMLREVKHIADLSRAYRQHVHDEVSIAHVWSGSTLALIDGEEVPISGECVVVIPPGVVHACNPVKESGWEYTLALLDPGACPAIFFEAPCWILPSTDWLKGTFRALRDGGHGPVEDILEHLAPSMVAPTTSRSGVPAHPRALRRVMEHLRARWAAPLDLEELCAVAGLSKYHLVRAFKGAYGLTPHAYLLNIRINEAKARLRQGQDLAAVALDVGFCDQSHLTRVFTRCVGLTPAAYQKATAIPSKRPPSHRP